jgi:hypothetical protein
MKPHPRKYALTGRLRSGKDHAAKLCNGTILGFADPLYAVGKSIFGIGVEGKDDQKIDMRSFYMKLGEWGKGTVDDQHPVTMERATFVVLMRAYGSQLCDLPVDWRTYGTNKNIWLESLLGRSFQESGEAFSDTLEGDFVPRKDIFVTNVRFKFELGELRKSDFDHFHSLCSEQTYIERLRQVGLTLGDQRLKHVSEMMANELDRQVYHILRQHPAGPKLKVIWNDDRPSPSDRLFSLDEFKTYVEDNANARTTEPEPEPGFESAETPDAGESQPNLADASAKATAGGAKNRNTRKGSRARSNS